MQVFRDKNGNQNVPGTADLQLCLRDFAAGGPAGLDLQLHDPIILTATKLFSLLEKAENASSAITNRTGFFPTFGPGVRIQPRQPSPPEKLNQKDEDRFRADETRAEDQTTKDDASYKSSSSE